MKFKPGCNLFLPTSFRVPTAFIEFQLKTYTLVPVDPASIKIRDCLAANAVVRKKATNFISIRILKTNLCGSFQPAANMGVARFKIENF